MYQINVSGSLEDHKAVQRAFANLVRELRKADLTIDARYLSIDGHQPDHVEHPSSKLPAGDVNRQRNHDGSASMTGENPQIISGTHGEVA